MQGLKIAVLALYGFRSTLAGSISVVLTSNICATTIAALRALAVTLSLSMMVVSSSLSLRGSHPSFDPPAAVACRERRFPRALALPACQAFASLKLTKPVHVRRSRTEGMRDASHEFGRRLRGPGCLDKRAICGLPNGTHANSTRCSEGSLQACTARLASMLRGLAQPESASSHGQPLRG